MWSSGMKFQLRKVDQQDWDFIWSLRVATMKDLIVGSYGWDEDTQRSYAEESLNGQIVLVDGVSVGVVTLLDWDDQLHLTWIAVLPEMQGRGIGTALIQYCQQQAVNIQKPLTLQVVSNNPSISLYKRCGFEIYAQNSLDKIIMRWHTTQANTVVQPSN
jgi:ribosomal protein S18 acetylase RimI-like enzyme